MAKVSVLIPARNEPYLLKTLQDIRNLATGDIEILVMLDGAKHPEYEFPEWDNLRVYEHPEVKGLRYCVNVLAELAKGKYIMKIDAHCTIGMGWDEILQADCADNWMVVPRRYLWDAPKWDYGLNSKGETYKIDAHYYFYPYIRPYNPRLTSRPWISRGLQREDILIDEDMNCQGSCWFMEKKLYKRIGGMSEYGYGSFSSEPEELGLKIQLGPVGGAIMRNKKTWYAHWQKPAATWWNLPAAQVGRADDAERLAGNFYCFDYWYYNRWTERVRDFDWLIDKFWPIPTWPENWRAMDKDYTRYDLSKTMGPCGWFPTATLDTVDDIPFREAVREHKRKVRIGDK